MLSQFSSKIATAQGLIRGLKILNLPNCIAIDSKFQAAIAFELLRICRRFFAPQILQMRLSQRGSSVSYRANIPERI